MLESKITAWSDFVREFVLNVIFSVDSLVQVSVVAASMVIAWAITRRLKIRQTVESGATVVGTAARRAGRLVQQVLLPLIAMLILWLAYAVLEVISQPARFVSIVATLVTAWVVIRTASSIARNPFWRNVISTTAWVIAALSILGWLDETSNTLDGLALSFGAVRISLLTIFKGLIAVGILAWLTTASSNLFEVAIKRSEGLTPSHQVLFAKLFKIAVVTLAFMLAIGAIGVDISAFAVLGGAVGVGLGFGLQKIVSNLISGVILLLDNSIKPGDVIAVADYYGRVDSLNARYVSVTTRDGTEHLIPNEELITTRVENWSHSHNLYRIRIPVGVHYKSDVHKAKTLCLEAAAEIPRILDEPKTACLLRGFGDSSVDFEIRFWINDPMNGRANVSSDLLLLIWDKFHENDIEIPYPQRDLHLRTPHVENLNALTEVLQTA